MLIFNIKYEFALFSIIDPHWHHGVKASLILTASRSDKSPLGQKRENFKIISLNATAAE